MQPSLAVGSVPHRARSISRNTIGHVLPAGTNTGLRDASCRFRYSGVQRLLPMKKHLLVALSLVLLAGPVLAQKNAVTDNASAKTRPLAADNSPKVAREAAKPADYSQEPFVIEEYRTAMRFENDGTARREVTARMHILSDAGVQAWG